MILNSLQPLPSFGQAGSLSQSVWNASDESFVPSAYFWHTKDQGGNHVVCNSARLMIQPVPEGGGWGGWRYLMKNLKKDGHHVSCLNLHSVLVTSWFPTLNPPMENLVLRSREVFYKFSSQNATPKYVYTYLAWGYRHGIHINNIQKNALYI